MFLLSFDLTLISTFSNRLFGLENLSFPIFGSPFLIQDYDKETKVEGEWSQGSHHYCFQFYFSYLKGLVERAQLIYDILEAIYQHPSPFSLL